MPLLCTIFTTAPTIHNFEYVYVCIQNIQSSVTHNLLWLMHFLSSVAKKYCENSDTDLFWQILNRTSHKRTRNAAFLSTSKHFERSKIVRSVPKITWNSAYNNRACGGWSCTYTLYVHYTLNNMFGFSLHMYIEQMYSMYCISGPVYPCNCPNRDMQRFRLFLAQCGSATLHAWFGWWLWNVCMIQYCTVMLRAGHATIF